MSFRLLSRLLEQADSTPTVINFCCCSATLFLFI
jgi:hypothetical protein